MGSEEVTIDQEQEQELASLFWDVACALPPGPLRGFIWNSVYDDEDAAKLAQRAVERFGMLSVEVVSKQIQLEAAAVSP